MFMELIYSSRHFQCLALLFKLHQLCIIREKLALIYLPPPGVLI